MKLDLNLWSMLQQGNGLILLGVLLLLLGVFLVARQQGPQGNALCASLLLDQAIVT